MSEFRVGGLYRIKDPDCIDFFDTERIWTPLSCGNVLMYLFSAANSPNSEIKMFLYEDKILHCYTSTNSWRMFPYAWFEGEVGSDD